MRQEQERGLARTRERAMKIQPSMKMAASASLYDTLPVPAKPTTLYAAGAHRQSARSHDDHTAVKGLHAHVKRLYACTELRRQAKMAARQVHAGLPVVLAKGSAARPLPPASPWAGQPDRGSFLGHSPK